MSYLRPLLLFCLLGAFSSPALARQASFGQLKIKELRARAESELGSNFDIKAFHTALLESEGLPLQILEDKMNNWIKSNGQ